MFAFDAWLFWKCLWTRALEVRIPYVKVSFGIELDEKGARLEKVLLVLIFCHAFRSPMDCAI